MMMALSHAPMVKWSSGASVKIDADLNGDAISISSLMKKDSSYVKMHIYVLIVNTEELSILIHSGIIDSLLEFHETLRYGKKR